MAYLQLDQARVPTFPIVDFLPVHNEREDPALPQGRRPERDRAGRCRGPRQGRQRRDRSASSSFTPDDVYVVPDLAFTPDGRGLAFMLLNRAQNELQLRLLRGARVPHAPPSAPPRTAAHGALPTTG